MSDNLQIFSVVTCSGCGYQMKSKLPFHATRTLFECPECRKVHRTGEGECCIFCSYGSVPCRPRQALMLADK